MPHWSRRGSIGHMRVCYADGKLAVYSDLRGCPIVLGMEMDMSVKAFMS